MESKPQNVLGCGRHAKHSGGWRTHSLPLKKNSRENTKNYANSTVKRELSV